MHPAQKHAETDRAIGAAVRDLRRQAGMSQQTLAEALGITFQQVQKYEKGTNRVAVSTLIVICRTLGANPATVIDAAIADQPATDLVAARTRRAKPEAAAAMQ